MVSCKPSNDGFQAGVVNNKVTYTEFSPIKVILNQEKDSIDVDNDLRYDFIFIKSPKSLLTGFAIKAEVLKKSNVQIMISSENQYPACLNYNDAINPSSIWSDSEQNLYVLQSYICGSDYCPLVGNFGNVTDKYMAFRIADYYGWIQIDNQNDGGLTIKGFAISK